MHITINSAANTLLCDSCPRYCCFVTPAVGLYAAAPILLSILDPFVSLHIVSGSAMSSGRIVSLYALASSLIDLMQYCIDMIDHDDFMNEYIISMLIIYLKNLFTQFSRFNVKNMILYLIAFYIHLMNE